ncbi:ZIP family metal transporter [uncultured Sphingomonas sp.]|uniref:ZIP family metal transporter n=1 Tax=uncultured Sphingomonas sp. TaxID=158754 RepID=UPI0025F3097F|nr:ZIP family metal transporter [uncultured Sphingomonas sp.]
MIILPLLLGAVAGLSTYVGGRLAMRWGQRRDLLFGLTGGMVIGLALLDLLPEALESGQSVHDAHIVFGATVAGVAVYILLHRLPAAGAAGRISLILHSVMDGLGIGIAFQLSSATGGLVAIAVLAHDMADGANMVGLSALSGETERTHRWLVVNAAAPLVGVVTGQAIPVDLGRFSLLLALFAGGFLYIGASELLPRSRSGRSGAASGLASLCGIAAMAGAVHFAG